MYLILGIYNLLLFPQASFKLMNQLQLTRSFVFPGRKKKTNLDYSYTQFCLVSGKHISLGCGNTGTTGRPRSRKEIH